MSDLSSPPPLSLVPFDAPAVDAATAPMPLEAPPAAEADAPPRREPFAWPTPPFAGYPSPVCMVEAEPCEIEGINGRVIHGRLLEFDLAQLVARVQVPPSRGSATVRFGQFRRLTLLQPLPMGPAAAADPDARPDSVPFRVQMKSPPALAGRTVGHREDEYGLFLFEPADPAGGVRRSFVPRGLYERFEIGEPAAEAPKAALPPALERGAPALRQKKIGDVLIGRQIATPEQLLDALARQASMPMVRIGEALMALGFVTQAQIEEALAQQARERGVPLGELLLRRGVVTREDLQTALARKMGYPLVDVQHFPVDVAALGGVPYTMARRLNALPLLVRDGRLVIAVEDPGHRGALDEIEFSAQRKIVPVLAHGRALKAAIDRAYRKLGVTTPESDSGPLPLAEKDPIATTELLATLEQQHQAEDRGGDEERVVEQSDNSLVKLINSMILEARSQGASDIHIECMPGREKVRIRFRRDGVLRPYLELPHTYRNAIIARLKIMCDLDISERRKPQDGKINMARFVPGNRLELRVATIPTQGGLEDVVLRLLASAKPLAVDELNLSPANLARLKSVVERPYGMLLCVGPTGSGKTTTLHSMMGYVNTPERKIWTAEDPIEITQPGLRQVQVNPKIGWTFAGALRAFLRADPDIIMVGEIRDRETAQIAIEASLTGHLVLSTLHTNSAPETVTRLLDMGMDPFNFADALLAVLAQRLVRRLCRKCAVASDATPDQVEELISDCMHVFTGVEQTPSKDEVLADWTRRFGRNGRLQHLRAVGCEACDGTGFRGRAGIHELMHGSRELRRLVQNGARAEDLQRQALADGMRTLRQDGIEKVLAGVTTIEEVRASS